MLVKEALWRAHTLHLRKTAALESLQMLQALLLRI